MTGETCPVFWVCNIGVIAALLDWDGKIRRVKDFPFFFDYPVP